MYFLIVIQKSASGTSQAITQYADLDSAKAAYHGELSYAMTAKTLLWDLVEIIGESGETICMEKWHNGGAE